MQFTRKDLSRAKAEASSYEIKDPKTSGLHLRVSPKGMKTYAYRRKVKGVQISKSLGEYKMFSIEEARSWAEEINSVNAAKRLLKDTPNHQLTAIITAHEALEKMKAIRSLSQGTLDDYKLGVQHFGELADGPLMSVSRSQVMDRFAELQSTKSKSAGICFQRTLSVLFNFVAETYRDDDGEKIITRDSPSKVLKQAGAKVKAPRRKVVIKEADLKKWYGYISEFMASDNYTQKLYGYSSLILLLTGLRAHTITDLVTSPGIPRPTEDADAEGITYPYYDANDKRIYYWNKETGGDRDSVLPISDKVAELLGAVCEFRREKPFIFCAATLSAPLSGETARNYGKKLEKLMGYRITRVDLRRTHATLLEDMALTEKMKRILQGHSTGDKDAHEGYVILHGRKVREAANYVSSELIKLISYYK